jgi:hypothetical protein
MTDRRCLRHFAGVTGPASGVSPQEAALVKCGSVEAFTASVKRILWTPPPSDPRAA